MLAKQTSDLLVERRDTSPGIDEEKTDIRALETSHRQSGQAIGQHFLGAGLEARGVKDIELEIEKPSRTLEPIARNPRRVVDDRAPAAGQSIEQGGFADIRSANDSDATGHVIRAEAQLPVGEQIAVIGEEIKRAVSNHWRQGDRSG
jgi:hypothetical protein